MRLIISIAVLMISTSIAFAREGSLRKVRDSIDDALEAVRDAERGCRDEVADLIKEAKAAARDLKSSEKREVADLEAVLEKALRRAKKSCGKKIIGAIEDALDELDALPRTEKRAPAYEPTMQDVESAKQACDRAAGYAADEKMCLDVTVGLFRGPHRAIALQVPASCAQTVGREYFKFCMEWAAKSKRSPIEVNAYCAKNSRTYPETKDCIAQWSASAAAADAAPAPPPPPPAKKPFVATCRSASDCESNVCLIKNAAQPDVGYCSMSCRVAYDCKRAAGGGRITDWNCEALTSNQSQYVCKRMQW